MSQDYIITPHNSSANLAHQQRPPKHLRQHRSSDNKDSSTIDTSSTRTVTPTPASFLNSPFHQLFHDPAIYSIPHINSSSSAHAHYLVKIPTHLSTPHSDTLLTATPSSTSGFAKTLSAVYTAKCPTTLAPLPPICPMKCAALHNTTSVSPYHQSHPEAPQLRRSCCLQ